MTEAKFAEVKSFFCWSNPETKKAAQQKLCFTATDQKFLVGILSQLAEDPDCCFVKYSVKPKDGMYLGRCFFVTTEKVLKTWAKYKAHPKLMCTVQDDQVVKNYRNKITNWKNCESNQI